jgi:hypothetical protein
MPSPDASLFRPHHPEGRQTNAFSGLLTLHLQAVTLKIKGGTAPHKSWNLVS